MQPDRPAAHRNRLALETSPYLLQHADNPVQWLPWGEESLALARADDKPILLSIGYSACHWCHVMAHESFEDPDTAALMNDLFVNIKVDREERPDLDKLYQIAQQMLTQQPGGWPLTMFLSSRQTPFFGGTYFPKEARHGMPSFKDILRRVADYYAAHRETIHAHTGEFQAAFARLAPPPPAADLGLDVAPLTALRAALAQSFDADWGGFGRAPKFPHPSAIEFCLRTWKRGAGSAEPDLQALFMASLTLTRMAEGGIYDQLAGGFCRYSTDEYWMIPHFEKMLYDNGPLLANYAHAALATGEGLFSRIAQETGDWLLRDLRAPGGGFFSAFDADSDGHEGRFYVWDRDAVREALTPESFAPFAARFGLNRPANFDGAWHLHVVESIEQIAAGSARSAADIAATLDAARIALLQLREHRRWPARDEKVLTSWNALAIRGLAIAGRSFERADFTQAASDAVDFTRRHLWRDGRLLAAHAGGRAHLPAYLDDHAYLADALLELLQTRWRTSDLRFVQELLDVMLDRFEDPVAAGFFFTADDHEALLHRIKAYGDEAIPSGNGIAARILCRAGYLLGETRYLRAAESTLRAAWHAMLEHPRGHVSLILALQDFLQPPQIVLLRGPAAEIGSWAQRLARDYAPGRLVFAIPDEEELPAAIAQKRSVGGATAYVCQGMTCGEPQRSFNGLLQALGQSAA